MTRIDPYEQWKLTRSAHRPDPAFTDRVMQAVRRLPIPLRPAAVGSWTIAAAVLAGGGLALARAACLLSMILLGPN